MSINARIRQGGVLSVIMYALMMDETNKALMETDLGIQIPNTNTKIPCLLWMDDVVLAETNSTRAQEQLNITNHTSLKFHVDYGMAKTKYLQVGKAGTPINLKLGEKQIDETDKYTYIREINNQRMNMKDKYVLLKERLKLHIKQ